MLINSIFLALSSSIDSLGIGITYGMKNTKISSMAKAVLFSISFSISLLSVWFGDLIQRIFSDFFTHLIGNMLLIAMGIFVCFQAIHTKKKKKPFARKEEKILGITIQIIKNPTSSDLDGSHSIDCKEAFFLGVALSLDCFCIGTCGSMVDVSLLFFPLFICAFQLIFLNLGNLLGKKLHQFSHLPDNIWSIISGILLILIGFARFIVLS